LSQFLQVVFRLAQQSVEAMPCHFRHDQILVSCLLFCTAKRVPVKGAKRDKQNK